MTRCLIGFIYLLMFVSNSAIAVEDDPIRTKLEKAKATHANALQQYHDAVAAFFEKQEDTARKNGNKKLIDQLKLSRTAYQEKGTLPQSFPVEPRKKYVAARSLMDAAYLAAIREYTRAKMDNEATAVEKEFELFKQSRKDKEAAWVVLFNGKDTKGWQESVGSRATWKVQNGILSGSRELGYLITTRNDYENFRLRVEAKLTGKSSDSGICFRVQDLQCIQTYEANINNTGGWGGLGIFLPGGATVGFANSRIIPPAGGWFTMEILVEGNKFATWIDGIKGCEAEDKQSRHSRGAIALQQHTGAVSFRKVEIMELPNK